MKAPYHYMPHGRNWAVYRFDDERRNSSTKVAEFFSKEEARAEVYRLNGWKYKKCS